MTEHSILLGPTDVGSYVGVRGNRIDCLELGEPPGDWLEELDCTGAWVWPGAVNAHTHIYRKLAPLSIPCPSARPQSLEELCQSHWWPLDQLIDAESLRAIARHYVVESLRYGTTTLIDHHESPNFIEGSLDVVADACEELGMRAVLCYGATERNDGAEEAERGLGECRRFLEENDRNLVRGVVGLHASTSVSNATVARAAELCEELDSVLHVHVAESGADVADAVGRGWGGPFERLHELGALPRGSILAHGVHLTEGQVRAARDYGCWFVQTPRSNDRSRVGYAGGLAASHRVALGTDGYPSNLIDEREALFRLGVQYGDREDILEERCAAAQRLVGELFGAPFGRPSAGSTADLVVREKDGRIRHVLVDGKVVMRDGVLLAGDRGEIEKVAEEATIRIREQLALG